MPPTLSPTRPGRLVRRALASRLVDMLAAPHGIDRYLELVDPLWTVHETRARVVAVDHQTERTVTLTLQPNRSWDGFQAGQHVVVGVEIDGTWHQRCFSLAGSPHRADGLLEFTVKANVSGRVSRHLVDHARAGAILRLSAARGEFTLPAPEDRTGHLLFVSGGSGITPVLSMLRTLVHEGHDGPVTFVHYADRLADVCYLDDLRQLTAALPQGRLLLGLTDDPAATDLAGFFDGTHLARVTDDAASCQVFLCGPAPLMASVEQVFAHLGLADRVHLERFGLPPIDPALADTGSVVGFERSGVRAPAAGTVLETAEAAGLRPAHGCRRGICGTCTTAKTSGVVRNAVTGVRSAPDAEPIRLCVSVPVAEVVVDL